MALSGSCWSWDQSAGAGSRRERTWQAPEDAPPGAQDDVSLGAGYSKARRPAARPVLQDAVPLPMVAGRDQAKIPDHLLDRGLRVVGPEDAAILGLAVPEVNPDAVLLLQNGAAAEFRLPARTGIVVAITQWIG